MIWLRSCVGVFRDFVDDRRGATAVEYALLAAVVGLGLVLALSAFQDDLYNVYSEDIAGALRNTAGGN